MNSKRLTKKQMIIFAIGQLGWSTLSGIISAWLVTFYLPTSTDLAKGATVYLYPFLLGGFITVLGLISALGRVFDAVTDPLIASLSDNSKNPRGRRTPFMQVAALPLAVVTVLLFSPLWGRYDSANGALNIVWVSVMLVLFYLFMTMYCTPYNSLISEYGKAVWNMVNPTQYITSEPAKTLKSLFLKVEPKDLKTLTPLALPST